MGSARHILESKKSIFTKQEMHGWEIGSCVNQSPLVMIQDHRPYFMRFRDVLLSNLSWRHLLM